MRRSPYIVIGLLALAIAGFAQDVVPRKAVAAEDSAVVQSIVGKFGKPDIDDSTAYDRPRPPFVTRWLIYSRQRVRVILAPAGVGTSDPPPYKGWRVLAMVDSKTGDPLTADQVMRRMGSLKH